MDEGLRFTFKKEERVTGEKRVNALFSNGRSFMAYPLRVVFLETASATNMRVSVLISVPKKRIKSAVKRNRMKRLIREAYRLNKHLLDVARLRENACLDVAFIYVKDELSDYGTIEKGMRKAMKELSQQMEQQKEQC